MRKIVFAVTLTLIAGGALADGPPPPVQVVANVLSLTDGQVAGWLQLLQARNAAVQPLQQQLQTKQQAIATLLQSPSPDPATLGTLFIDAHAIEIQVMSLVQQTNGQFESLLTDEQRLQLQRVREAAQVCPIVPALQATGLI